MKKATLIAALQDVPDDAEVLIAPGMGEGDLISTEWSAKTLRVFGPLDEMFYIPGVTEWDVDFPVISAYDPDTNAVWLEL